MGYTKPRIIVILAVFALLISLCFVPSIAGTSSPAEEAEGQGYSCEFSLFYLEAPPVEVDLGSDAIAAAYAPPIASETPTAPKAPVDDEPVPVGEEEPDAPAEAPEDAPAVSALDPALPGPTNLTGVFYPQGWGNSRNNLSWTKASPDTGVLRYIIPEWTDDDFASMVTIFNLLAVQVPSAAGPAASFATHTNDAMQPGLTVTERQDIADLIELDLDALFAIIAANSADPVVQGYWDDLIALADLGYAGSSQDKYQRNKLVLEKYYFYVVLAEYAGGDTSPPSNSWGVYAYWGDGPAPAQPTGFTATAYDPGVALEWDPNLEMDLAGYNVYELQGGTPVQLNSALITQGTEYFHMTGTVGATYYVEAVNMAELASTQASAFSVLAPATIYDADNLGWSYLGQWAREDYSDPVLYGGSVLQVARDGGATASVDFNGRRVKVFCSRYWQGGQVRFWVDGVDYGVVNLYKVEPLPARDIEWGYQAFVVTGLDKGSHTLVLEVLGAGCPEPPPPEYPTLEYNFVNFEYAESR